MGYNQKLQNCDYMDLNVKLFQIHFSTFKASSQPLLQCVKGHLSHLLHMLCLNGQDCFGMCQCEKFKLVNDYSLCVYARVCVIKGKPTLSSDTVKDHDITLTGITNA